MEKTGLAVAPGVLSEREIAASNSGAPADPATVAALQAGLDGARNPNTIGAFAIALGLCQHRPASDALRALLREHRQRDDLAGYLCIGLGLMADDLAIGEIRAVMQGSERRPQVLLQRARALGRLRDGPGAVCPGGEGVEAHEDADDAGGAEGHVGDKDRAKASVELTDLRQLGIATLGTLKEHPRIKRLRDFLKGWYLSYFYPDAARSLPTAGPQKHLNSHGDNIGNVVQFMAREHKDRFKTVLDRIAAKIPGITSIDTQETQDKRLLLRFNDGAFADPFFAQQMSDGTLKVFAYLLLMDDPEPPPFICIEEPENGLYHKLLEALAQEFRSHANGKKNAPDLIWP